MSKLNIPQRQLKTMNPLSYNPLAKASPWVLSLLDISSDEVIDYIPQSSKPNFATVALSLDMSDDPNEVMSAFVHVRYLMNRDNLSHAFAVETLNDISEYRLEQMVMMREDVRREVIRMLKHRDDAPSSIFCIRIGEIIRHDSIAKECMIDLWIDSHWQICPEFVFAVRDSPYAWKLIHEVNEKNEYTSRSIIYFILTMASNTNEILTSFRTLLGCNESVLRYLMTADRFVGSGIIDTVNAIDVFDLWDVVLRNNAASPIIDYALSNFTSIKGGSFQSKKEMRTWLIPMLSSSNLLVKYVSKEDIECNLITKAFFRNHHAIDLIAEWINDDNVSKDLIYNLVCIAACDDECSAGKALDLIYNTKYQESTFIHLLTISHWGILFQSKFAKDFVCKVLGEADLEISIVDVLRFNAMVPYWKRSWDGEYWEIQNMTIETLNYAHLDYDFYMQTEDYIEYLTYENWKVLLQTEIGITLGYENIGYVIENGLLYEMFRSEFMPKELIEELSLSTDALEYSTDEEFTAIISRDDAYEIDLQKAYEGRIDLCQDLLQAWFEPMRLQRFAKSSNMSMREYLSAFD